MNEEYSEYKRNRKKTSKTVNTSHSYLKKFIKQLFISTICLAIVLSLKTSDTDIGKNLSGYIKSAINYQINTAPITSFIKNTVKFTENENVQNGDGSNAEEIEDTSL